MSGTRVLQEIDRLSATLNEAQNRDLWGKYRAQIVGVYQWPNPDGSPSSTDSRDCDFVHPTNYLGTVSNSIIGQLKKWVSGRYAWIDSQYPLRPPNLNHPGGLVGPGFYCIISATNPVYYTLDGTDPRLPGGAISPTASLYSAQFAIGQNVRVFTRVRTSDGTWGPPATATLFTQAPSLGITEIMYHPLDPPAGSPYAGSDFEYLEVKNTGTAPINLRNVRLAGLFNDSDSALRRRQAVVRRHEQHGRATIRHGPGRLAISRVATYDDSERQVVGFENGRVATRFVDRAVDRGVELAIQTGDAPFVNDCR